MSWSSGLVFQLLSEAGHKDTKVVGTINVARPPNFQEKLTMSQYLAVAACERREQSKLDWRQVYHFVRLSYLMGRHVHSNISKTDHGRCRLIGIEKCGTTELSAYACQKFRNTKGLREIIVRARVKCFDLFFLTLSGRQNYDRYIRPGSELPDESLSVTVGKTEIDNGQLRPAAGRINPRLLSRLRLSDTHASLFERDTDKATNIRLILDD